MAEHLNANESVFMPMSVGSYTFSMTGLDFAQPFVQPGEFGVMLVANQWGDGNWWDKAVITFTATVSGTYVLTYGTISDMISNVPEIDGDLGSLHHPEGEGHIMIFRNDTMIWPEDGEPAAVREGQPIPFPTLTIDLAVGDVVRVAGYGSLMGGSILDPNPNSWHNHILLDPVITLIEAGVVEPAEEDISIEDLDEEDYVADDADADDLYEEIDATVEVDDDLDEEEVAVLHTPQPPELPLPEPEIVTVDESGFAWIILIIVAAVVIAGGIGFVILRKK